VSASPSNRPIVRANAGGLGGGFSAALDRLRREAADAMQGTTGAAPSSAGTLVGVSFADDAPSWVALQHRVAELRAKHGLPVMDDLETGPANSKALVRRFDAPKDEEPRVLFYRDSAAWCPYCQKIWMQLEEKRIPYRIDKINMRCYGDKKPEFTKKVPSGILPALELDGALLTESAVIADALEKAFPEIPLLPADGTSERKRATELLKLERALFSRWMGWLTSGWADGQNRSGFEDVLDVVDAELRATPGSYFMGETFTLVDITFAPFLERMAASLAYYKGFRMEGNGGRWAGLDAWYAAMALRPTYAGIKSDYYTHCHDLPPQLGGCEANGDDEQRRFREAIDGEGDSWRLPLEPLTKDSSPEPSWTGENPDLDRLEAAFSLVGNHAATVRFAARGCGKKGTRPVSAPLADPTAVPGEEHIPAVDAALRRVVHELLEGSAEGGGKLKAAAKEGSLAGAPAADALAYLRDRVGVPRDMKYPAARQLRAHINWFIDALEA
jgi:glutathione S-transferase